MNFDWNGMEIDLEYARDFFGHWNSGFTVTTEEFSNLDSPESLLITKDEAEALMALDLPPPEGIVIALQYTDCSPFYPPEAGTGFAIRVCPSIYT